MKKQCVVSFADTQFYQDKMKRLEDSLKGNFDGDFIGFTNVNQIGAPPHKEIPYAFKPYAIQKVIDMGYEQILWLDSAVVAIKNIQPVFDHIEKHGYLFFNNPGHPLGKWSHDTALNYFNKTREEAMNIKQVMACVLGIGSAMTTVGRVFHPIFSPYKGLTWLYPGSWENSRHDQMVLSFLIEEKGLDILEGHRSFFIYEHFKHVLEFQPISENVCLVSR